MSAIDFKVDLQREPDPNGDRVKIYNVRKIPSV